MIYNVLSYFEQAAQNTPEQIAIADNNICLTYHEVWTRVCWWGEQLNCRFPEQKHPIAVFIHHNTTDLLAFFAVVYSGHCYVPVDPSLPRERVETILKITAPCAVICEGATEVTLEGCPYPVIKTDQLNEAALSVTQPWKKRKDTDPLYIIFTSGSTGEPKGVVVSHRSVIDMVEQFNEAFNFPQGCVFGNQAPFDFDVSVKDIYLAMSCSGTVEILEKKLFSFPKLLIQRLNERKVDTLIWAVPALKIFASLRAFEKDRPLYLENIMFSGEIMPLKTLQYWMEYLPSARYVNLYGPTEITCNCTYHIVDKGEQMTGGVPIGVPFANCSVLLLEEGAEVTKEGEIGEICVSGSCLALGYYNRPELTNAAFVQNPIQQSYPEKIYRTGDLGRYENGVLMFCGRRDTQIKHMGHRIELTEIEICVNSMDGVESCACVYDQAAAHIYLFYIGTTVIDNFYEQLKTQLPRYMTPNKLINIDAFPKTRTGKIDKKALLKTAKGE